MKRKFITYSILFLFTLLIIGRFFSFPMAIFIINGNSMLPTLKPGDIVFTVQSDYKEGDIVVWFYNLFQGVVHRVAGINSTYVITKGDNNPFEDPPVPKSWIKYKVILIINREIWLSVLSIILIFMAYRYLKRSSIKIKRKKLNFPLISLTFFIILDLIFISFIVIPPGYSEIQQFNPNVELLDISLSSDGNNITVHYYLTNTILSNINYCTLQSYNISSNTTCIIKDSNLIAYVPKEIYSITYNLSNSTISKILLFVNISLSFGYLIGNYSIYLNWKKLEVNVKKNLIEIYNPNFIDFNLTNIKIIYIRTNPVNKSSEVIKEVNINELIVYSRNFFVLNLEKIGNYAYVEFKYKFKFSEKGEVFERIYVETQ